jgi:hypothetical protein
MSPPGPHALGATRVMEMRYSSLFRCCQAGPGVSSRKVCSESPRKASSPNFNHKLTRINTNPSRGLRFVGITDQSSRMLVMAGSRHGQSLLVFIGVNSWFHFLSGDRGLLLPSSGRTPACCQHHSKPVGIGKLVRLALTTVCFAHTLVAIISGPVKLPSQN